MILYRFAHQKFAHDLSGNGAKLKGGRWNPPGIPVLYTSETISLGLLEILANAMTLEQLQMIRLMEIEIPTGADCHEIKLQGLKKNWYRDFEYTQYMGQEMLRSAKTLLYRCPSAIIHQEHNYLLNPLHADFKKVKLKSAADFYFDERLFPKLVVS